MVSGNNKIVIVGGGVVGVSTFYVLARKGLSPILLEASSHLAAETSFANGGLLTPSMPEPWNGPGVAGHLMSSLFDPKSPMKIRPAALPTMIPWGLKFLRNSTSKRHRTATIGNFNLAQRSVEITRNTIERYGIHCETRASGTLKLFSSAAAARQAKANAEILRPRGLESELVSAREAIGVEPQLASIEGRIASAIHYRGDVVADANKFTNALALVAQEFGGEVKTRRKARYIETHKGAIVGVETDDGFVAASDVIVAAGNASPALLRSHGVRLPMKPAKGYSLTVDAQSWADRPQTPVIDDSMHAAITPIGNKLRIAGTAEFAGNDLTLDRDRVDNLYSIFGNVYPNLAGQVDREACLAWTGLRPMSADGMPFIGCAGPRGLWVNTGHGHLGWTMAMGSAELLGQLVMGEDPVLDPAPYRVKR